MKSLKRSDDRKKTTQKTIENHRRAMRNLARAARGSAVNVSQAVKALNQMAALFGRNESLKNETR